MMVQQTPTATAALDAQNRVHEGWITVEKPATGEIIDTVPNRTADEVCAAVARVRAVRLDCAALGFDERGAVLRRAQRWLCGERHYRQ